MLIYVAAYYSGRFFAGSELVSFWTFCLKSIVIKLILENFFGLNMVEGTYSDRVKFVGRLKRYRYIFVFFFTAAISLNIERICSSGVSERSKVEYLEIFITRRWHKTIKTRNFDWKLDFIGHQGSTNILLSEDLRTNNIDRFYHFKTAVELFSCKHNFQRFIIC